MLDLIPPWAQACAIVLVCAWLNRVRGGGMGGQILPGRAVLWVSVAIGLVAWSVNPWPVAVAFGLGYLAWGLPSWGYTLAALGDYVPGREMSWLERLFEGIWKIPAAFLRMLFVLPGVVAVAWLMGHWWLLAAAFAFAAAAATAYAVLLHPRPQKPDEEPRMSPTAWRNAEIVTGACWGLLILSPNL